MKTHMRDMKIKMDLYKDYAYSICSELTYPKSNLTINSNEVTCKNCLKILEKESCGADY